MHSTKPARRPATLVLRHCATLGLICLAATACGMQRGQHAAGRSGAPASPGSGGHTQAAGGHTQAAGGHTQAAGGHTQAASGPCTAAQLSVTLDLKSAGVAAGTSLIPLDFTNTSAASCDLSGFADVTFVTSSAGHQVGPAATVDRSLSPKSLRLVAGDSAHLWLRLVQAADLPAGTCEPKAVAGLLVKLPGQATSIFVRHQFTTCAKRLHGTDILTVEPFQAGKARAGTAQ